MLRIRTLGVVEVRDAGGRLLRDLLAAPKRLGLLTYLALAGSSGARRDEIVSVFWPEVDGPHARATLRQTLRLLRADVGEDVIRCSGDVVWLDPGRVWCDATALEAEAGDRERVLALYQGPFLRGLHVPNAGRGFEDWRAGSAERLRQRAARTLRAAARAAEAARDSTRAETLWQRLRMVAPWDESAVRGVMRCLVRSDRPGEALRTYDVFAGELRRHLDVGPARRTTELVRRIRVRASRAPGSPRAARRGGPSPAAPGQTAGAFSSDRT